MSIGASTAVFGALGILGGHRLLRNGKGPGRRSALLSIGGALALLAFLGSGAHTDVTAHMFGFAGGIILGMGYGALGCRPSTGSRQLGYGLAAVGILAACWLVAMG